jgi:hypothetical protein
MADPGVAIGVIQDRKNPVGASPSRLFIRDRGRPVVPPGPNRQASHDPVHDAGRQDRKSLAAAPEVLKPKAMAREAPCLGRG